MISSTSNNIIRSSSKWLQKKTSDCKKKVERALPTPLPWIRLWSASIFFFDEVCRVIVANIYDLYVTLLSTDKEWKAELKAFIENYEFPWGGFHVIVSCKLKGYYRFKKKYPVNNLGQTFITNGFYMLLLELPPAFSMHVY